MQNGLTQAQIDSIDSYQDGNAFSHREQLGLEYAERISLSDKDVDEAFFARLQAEFPKPEQIVELTAIIAFENFRSKFNHALLVESNGVCLLQSSNTEDC